MTSLPSFFAPSSTPSPSAQAGMAQPIPTARAAVVAKMQRWYRELKLPSRVARVSSANAPGALFRKPAGARHRTKAEHRRHDQRVDSRAPGHHDVHVLRAIRHSDVIGIARFRKPARAAMAQSYDRALRKPIERNARALENRLPDFRLAD